MMLGWFNAREAAEVGTALADQFASQTTHAATRSGKPAQGMSNNALEELLNRADSEVRKLRLNVYKKAKFANSFKWRLIENGVAKEIADEVTQSLVLHLSQSQIGTAHADDPAAASADRPGSTKARTLFKQGNKSFARGAYAEAAASIRGFGRTRTAQCRSPQQPGGRR